MTQVAGVLLLASMAGAAHAWALPSPVAWGVCAALALAAACAATAFRLTLWLLPAVLLGSLVYVRSGQQDERVRTLDSETGQIVTLSGVTDGRFLTLNEPPGVRVLTHDGLGPGQATLRGRLRAAQGQRNPGGFDERRWLHAQGVRHVLKVDAVLVHHPKARPRLAAAKHGLTGGRHDAGAQVLAAMVLGVRGVDADVRERFSRSGLAHLLALSGLHVGLLAGVFVAVLKPLGRIRWLLAVGLVLAYGSVVGFTPSLQRATVMLTLGAVWLAAGRKRPPLLALAMLAAVLALVHRPAVATGLSFQLSYAAVAGILLLAGPPVRALESSALPRLVRWPLSSLTVSAAASAGTASLVAGTFQQVPLAGPLVNLVAMPVATLVVPAGFLTASAGALHGGANGGLPAVWSAPVHTAANLLDRLALAGAQLPVMVWGDVAWSGHALWFLALGALVAALHGRITPAAAGVLACLAALVAWSAAPTLEQPEAVVLDVGQGNAVVVRTPSGHTWLIDAGGTPFGDYDVGAEVVVPALRALGVFRLDVAVATHPDADHIEGLTAVLPAVPTDMLLHGHGLERPLWQEVQDAALQSGVPVESARRGQTWRYGQTTFRILHPTGEADEDANANSVVVQIDWRDRPWLLLTGDIDARVERDLPAVPTPVLLAAHHGARDGTGHALLAKTGPQVAVISAGRGNRYGHPHDGTLARLEDRGVSIMRTDQDGAVRLQPAW